MLLLGGKTWPWTKAGERSRSHRDRKSTRLNSSHLVISYAVFCLKKKKRKYRNISSPSLTFNLGISHPPWTLMLFLTSKPGDVLSQVTSLHLAPWIFSQSLLASSC